MTAGADGSISAGMDESEDDYANGQFEKGESVIRLTQ
jgi:hypothetical protein